MSDNYQPVYKGEDEEIQLGSLWTRIKGSFRYLIRKWYWMLLGLAIFSGFGLFYSWWYGKKYIATTTFAVQGETAQNALLSSAISLASSLGLGAGASSHTGYDNNFFANLIQSRRVIMESMLQEATVNGKKDFLANHYIDLYKWRTGSLIHKGWKDDPRLRDFKFSATDVEKMTKLEDSIMHKIYDNVIDNNLEVVYDETIPFNTVTFVTRNRDFSRYMLSKMLYLSAGYYMENIYDLNQKSLSLADYRVDSLANVLKDLDYKVANLRDVTNMLIKQKGYLDLNTAIRNQSLMNIQYSSAVNNLELAKVTLLTNAPILQVIDDPLFSTQVSFISPVTSLIVAFIVGFFITAGIMLLGKVVRDSSERKNKKAAGTAIC